MLTSPTLLRRCAAALAALALCGAALAEQVLRVVPSSDLKIIDPIWTTANITRNHGYMIYDTLFGMDEKGAIKPQMVDKYSASPDNKVWTFTLRPGLKFHDGTPVTSQDVIASLARWGKRDMLGQRMYATMERIEAQGSNGFRMTFKQPFGVVLDALGKTTSNVPFIMPAKVAATPADQQIDNLIGSGPFTLSKEDYRPGDRAIYHKNTAYVPRKEPASGLAGGKVVKVDSVEWVFMRDPQTQTNALLNGEVDVVEVVLPANAVAIRASDKTKMVEVLPPGMFQAYFNHKVPPFDNPKMVRAAMLAMNQEAMLRGQVGDRSMYKPCASIYPCSSPYGNLPTGFYTGKPQFEAAKKLLKEAGYDGTPVVVLLPSDLQGLNKLPLIYGELLKQAGFKVDVQQMDWASMVARRAKKEPADKGGWNVFLTYWNGVDLSDPVTYSALTGSGDAGYFGWATDPELEALKERYIETSDPAQRRTLAGQMQIRALDGGVVVPVGEVSGMTGARRNVSGLLHTSANLYWNVEKK